MATIIRIGLVGGGSFCGEVLKKTSFYDRQSKDGARIVAVADANPHAPGMVLARKMGLVTVGHYRELYNPDHAVDLIILLAAGRKLFDEVLKSRPAHIRLLSNNVFRLLWNTISLHEKALKARTRELVTVLNGIQDFILVMTPDRKIVDVNEAFLEQMGYRREEILGRTCHEVFLNVTTPCEPGDSVCPLNEAIQNKESTQQVMARLDHQGNRRYMEVSIFPIWETNGDILRFIEISRDITKRKMQEEEMTKRLERMVAERTRELKETHAKLLHQDKMASLGKLSASVVHEINNPIAGILNLLMLMKRIMNEEAVDEQNIIKFQKYVELMETETRRIGRIVSDLLLFSRQSGANMKPVNLNRIIEQTLLLNANLLEIHHIQVKTDLDANLPLVYGSEDQLQQVFMNLASNAVEAMEPFHHGVLGVRTEYLFEEDRVQVTFEDSGPGISRENLDRIFEPFFTTKTRGKGVGLGLSIVYGIIEEQGGVIQATSDEGVGAAFRVRLPVYRPDENSTI